MGYIIEIIDKDFTTNIHVHCNTYGVVASGKREELLTIKPLYRIRS